jgi:hypothetical protein
VSDWKDWDRLLGPGERTESSSGSSEHDAAGREGTVIIRRRKKKDGRAIFEIFMQAKPAGFAPTGAEVVRLEVEGFNGQDCSGRKKCAQQSPLPPNGKLLRLAPGSKYTFEPADSDNGILSGLLAKCGCHLEGIESYKIYVEVQFVPANPQGTLRFAVCYPCGLIEG